MLSFPIFLAVIKTCFFLRTPTVSPLRLLFQELVWFGRSQGPTSNSDVRIVFFVYWCRCPRLKTLNFEDKKEVDNETGSSTVADPLHSQVPPLDDTTNSPLLARLHGQVITGCMSPVITRFVVSIVSQLVSINTQLSLPPFMSVHVVCDRYVSYPNANK